MSLSTKCIYSFPYVFVKNSDLNKNLSKKDNLKFKKIKGSRFSLQANYKNN